MKNWLPFLEDLAEYTDKIASEFFNKVDLQVQYKKDNSPVSEADQKIEEFVRETVKKKNPCLSVYGEEFGEDQQNELRLIIDPIDGTRNFVRGIPIFATLLAIEHNQEIIAGLVSAPLLKTKWSAEKGQGAFLNKRKIKVSKIDSLKKAQLFHSSLSGNEIRENVKPIIINIVNQTERQRGFGDFYQHVLVAQGSGEAAVDPEVKPWDIAALKIILEEAGGKLTSWTGKDSIYEGNAVTSNGLVHQDILKLLEVR